MFKIRKVDPKDLPVIVDYRIQMFQTFLKKPYNWEAVKQFEIQYFQEKMRDSQFAAWVAETEEGAVIATAAVSFYETAPKPWNLESKYAFISSMYTEPEFRRQGIGGRLLKVALDFLAEQRHCTCHPACFQKRQIAK